MTRAPETLELARDTEIHDIDAKARQAILDWCEAAEAVLRTSGGTDWCREIAYTLPAMPRSWEQELLASDCGIRLMAALRLMLHKAARKATRRLVVFLAAQLKLSNLSVAEAYDAAGVLTWFGQQLAIGATPTDGAEMLKALRKQAVPISDSRSEPTLDVAAEPDEVCAYVARAVLELPLKARVALIGIIWLPQLKSRIEEDTERDAREYVARERGRTCEACGGLGVAPGERELGECPDCDQDTLHTVEAWLRRRRRGVNRQTTTSHTAKSSAG